MRARTVAVLAASLVAVLLLAGGAWAGAQRTDVACSIEANVLTCPLPEPVTVTNTETVTITASPTSSPTSATTTSSVAPTSTSAQPTSASAPAQPAAWPDASNTGVPAGTVLTDYTGPCTIQTDNTVIDSKTVNCPLAILAANVTIKNSKVNGHVYMDNDRSNRFSLTIMDTEVDGGDYTWPTVATGNTKIYRANLHGGQNGLTCDDGSAFCEMTDSWVHGQDQKPGVDTHLGGFLSLGAKATCTGTDGKCIVLRHNSIVCDAPVNDVGGGCTGGINLIPHFSKLHDVLIEGNRIGANTGQSFCTYGGELGVQQATGIVYRNNVFEKGTNGTCGAYGPVTAFRTGNPGNVWDSNVWDDGTPVTPAN